MSTERDLPFRTFTATATAIANNSRVKLDNTGAILVAGAAESSIGITTMDIAASGKGTVKLYGETQLMTASAAITAGDKLEDAAAGKVATLAAGTGMGYQALESASGDGAIIECAQFRG